MLKLIKSPAPPEPPDYPAIYKRAIARKLKDIPDTPSKDWVRQFVYLAVKGVPIIWEKDIHRGFSNKPIPSEECLQEMWHIIDYTAKQIARLTPKEMTKIFPITKDYDGHKFECKDYFTTIQMIEDIGLDIPIADNIDTFLFDYRNRHIIHFNVFKMCLCSDLRRYQGQPGIIHGARYERISLNLEDIHKYNLPNNPDAVKKTDRRCQKFVDQYGEYAVELDALHPKELKRIATDAVQDELDMVMANSQVEKGEEDKGKIDLLASFIFQFTLVGAITPCFQNYSPKSVKYFWNDMKDAHKRWELCIIICPNHTNLRRAIISRWVFNNPGVQIPGTIKTKKRIETDEQSTKHPRRKCSKNASHDHVIPSGRQIQRGHHQRH